MNTVKNETQIVPPQTEKDPLAFLGDIKPEDLMNSPLGEGTEIDDSFAQTLKKETTKKETPALETKDGKKNAEGKNDEGVNNELKTDDFAFEWETVEQEAKAQKPEKDDQGKNGKINYGEVLKEYGFEGLSEDDPETFKKKIAENLERVKTKAAQEALSNITADDIIEQLPEQAQKIVKFIKEGGTIEEFYGNTSTIDQYLKMDDATMVRENLKAMEDSNGKPFYSEEKINQKIERLRDSEMLEEEAEKIRLDLHDTKKNIQQQTLLRKKQEGERTVIMQQEIKDKEVSIIKETLRKMDGFMGGKLSDSSKEKVVKVWESGEAKKIFSTPEKIVRFILFDQYGEQAEKFIRDKAFTEGKEKVMRKLHNVPPSLTNGASRYVPTDNDATGFDRWANVKGEFS